MNKGHQLSFINIMLILGLIININILIYLKNFEVINSVIFTWIIALFFLNISKFTKFKTALFEAEIQKTIDEANATIEELRELSLALTEPVIIGMVMGNNPFLGYIKKSNKIQMKNKITSVLNKINIDEDSINNVTKFMDDIYVSEHAERILCAIKKNEKEVNCIEIEKVIKGIKSKETYASGKQKILEFLSQNNIKDLVKEEIDDMDFFLKNGELRREGVWQG